MGQRLIYVPECHSTNSLLNELNDQSPLPEGAVVVTSNQTAGRGQRGNSWITEPGRNLTCSILLNPRFLPAKDQFQLNMMVSLSILSALKGLVAQIIKLKWPNDLYIEGRKVGGILIESQLQGDSLSTSIVGIGININQESFDQPLAASLYNFAHSEFDLNEIFELTMESLEYEYEELRSGRTALLKQRYLNALYKYEEEHQFETDSLTFSGFIQDVDEQGKLMINSQGLIRRFAFKEVRFLN
ncbi:MAG TPA: biotin--[acetyl-CoA-carboxylase] ligase [Cyclobacteriaceae bacterium]|nr:biotin--[acetyl-CoA-carboxylase] ligase [Cyclobacteriaceae bacterium]